MNTFQNPWLDVADMVQAPYRSRSYTWALGCVVVFNTLDVITTKLALDRGASEGNPVSAWLLAHQLLWPVKLAVVALFAAVCVARRTPSPAELARGWFAAGLYACVVIVNLLTLGRFL